jgi:hypothetical protein
MMIIEYVTRVDMAQLRLKENQNQIAAVGSIFAHFRYQICQPTPFAFFSCNVVTIGQKFNSQPSAFFRIDPMTLMRATWISAGVIRMLHLEELRCAVQGVLLPNRSTLRKITTIFTG